MTTRELLSETVYSACARELASLDGLAPQSGAGIVLYGAGRLGRKTAGALRLRGVEPLAFADNDARLHGGEVEGVPVLSPAAAAGRWGAGALFVVTTFRPNGGGMRFRLNELASQGCRRAASFLPVGWRHEGILPHFGADLPSRLLRHAGHLREVGDLLSDEISRETFRLELAWRLRAEFEETAAPAPDQYFPRDILRPNPDEVFVDGGAFDGDTLRSAPWRLARILAIEPDPASAAILRSSGNTAALVHEVLLGRAAGSARFNGGGTTESARSQAGSLELKVATLDELAAGENPTFVKLDVEGDELAALQGGIKTLRRTQPVVAVCLYHGPEDLWRIPLFLHEALPSHRICLRAHAWDGFELVAYAVPPGRCLIPR
jgi:FkbM family methyltransferase